jgi:phthalate 4,5-dioxygenase
LIFSWWESILYMISAEENMLLTQTGKGTPCGELMRRYWQPVALSEEVVEAGAPLAVQVMGEKLVLFRDDQGRPGLLSIHCSHRGTDLSYGRVEDGGLRCLYHGWLFNVEGRCLEQPGEPGGGEHRDAIRHPAYPCKEAGGVIFAYMGPDEPPVLPAYEFLTVPAEQCAVTKIAVACNYLQGNEGNIDPVHLSFLHRNLQDSERDKRRVVRGSNATPNSLIGKDQTPTIEVEITEFGLRIYTIRKPGDGKQYLRVTNYIYPNLAAFNGSTTGEGYSVHWHVPIDDRSHWKYAFLFSRERPLNRDLRDRIRVETTDGNHLKRNEDNRYLQDRASMKTQTFSGMGFHFHAQDAFATESQGVVQDRIEEHLVSSDKAIVASRKLLLNAIHAVRDGRELPHVVRDPSAATSCKIVVLSEVLPADVNPRAYVKGVE